RYPMIFSLLQSFPWRQIRPIFGYFSSLGTVLSFPLHSLSPLANPSCENLVVLASSQFQQAGCGYTHVLLML
ncbi:MAG: hypothetical protein LUD70_14300, partial [Bacteroides ovatus]|nr:hypothetical protein [Bacteroides ovatus]